MKKLTPIFFALLMMTLFSCNNAPTSSFTYEEGEDGTIMFHDSCQNTKTYQWDFGDETFEQLPSPSHKFEKNGKYNVKLTATNGKESASSILTVEVTTVKPTYIIIYALNSKHLPIAVTVDDIFVGNIILPHLPYPVPQPNEVGFVTVSTTAGKHKIFASANQGTYIWKEFYLDVAKGETKTQPLGD